jgi:hypothetical protein
MPGGKGLSAKKARSQLANDAKLTETRLLERCLRSLTQNSNESMHSCVWSLLPKVKFFARYRLDHGAAQAVLVFNQGQSAVT